MQPDMFETIKPAPAQSPTAELHRQLVRLGDMISEGLAEEPDGAWINKEYRRVCKALGYVRPRRNNGASIDLAVAKYIDTAQCECGGRFKQSRSGSMRVYCAACTKRYQLKEQKAPRG